MSYAAYTGQAVRRMGGRDLNRVAQTIKRRDEPSAERTGTAARSRIVVPAQFSLNHRYESRVQRSANAF